MKFLREWNLGWCKTLCTTSIKYLHLRFCSLPWFIYGFNNMKVSSFPRPPLNYCRLHSYKWQKKEPFPCAVMLSRPWGCWLSSWCIVLLAFQLSQGNVGPTIRSGVNYLYFSWVLLSIRLLWKPYFMSFFKILTTVNRFNKNH